MFLWFSKHCLLCFGVSSGILSFFCSIWPVNCILFIFFRHLNLKFVSLKVAQHFHFSFTFVNFLNLTSKFQLKMREHYISPNATSSSRYDFLLTLRSSPVGTTSFPITVPMSCRTSPELIRFVSQTFNGYIWCFS